MKKIFFLLVLFVGTMTNAQEKKEYPQDINKSFEIKLNAFNLIGLNAFDLTFEKIINQESSYGASVFFNFDEISGETIGFPRKFSTTGFYRWFFSENKVARGFFLEGFGMLNTLEDEIYDYDFNSNISSSRTETSVNFALGISVGGKFALKSGFITEIYLGIGRNIIKGNDEVYNDAALVSRGGISLGYRF